MSVIAGWSIYEGLLTNILQTQKMEKKRNRKPNWTEEQGLLLAQLVNEHKGMLRGKFGPTVTSQGKRRAWDTISQTINASFPLVVRTGDDCEKRWYVLQSKAKDEIAAHKRESSLTGEQNTVAYHIIWQLAPAGKVNLHAYVLCSWTVSF